MENEILLLIISMAAALVGAITKKYYTDRLGGSLPSVLLYNAIAAVVTVTTLFFWGGFGETSVYTLLLGVIFGALTSAQTITFLKALKCGPMSYTSIMMACSSLIPALSGSLFFGESLEWSHGVGFVLMLISFALALEKKNGESGVNHKWFFLVLMTFLSTGAIGLMQKIHQSSSHKSELNSFLITAFLCSLAFSVCYLSLLKAKCKGTDKRLLSISTNQHTEKNPRIIITVICLAVILSGVAVAANNKLNIYLSGVMDSAVFFPIVNGGGLVLNTIAAVLLFRERLSLKKWVGVVVGILSVLFLCNPFN